MVMNASKLGMKDFVARVPKEYFHLTEDCEFPLTSMTCKGCYGARTSR
jgi:hypothetical protein